MSLYRSKHSFLRGEDLVSALVATEFPVKWLRAGDRSLIRFLSVVQAISLINSGLGTYEGKARPGRVFFIREVSSNPSFLPDDSLRFGMPAVRICCDFKAAASADCVQDLEVVARLQQIRRQEYSSEVRKIPSGRWRTSTQPV